MSLDWPAPKEAAVETEDTNEKDKFVETKVKNKGQWKPFTPTLVHAASTSPRAPAAHARKNIRRTSERKEMKKPATATNTTTNGATTRRASKSANDTAVKSETKEEEKKPKSRSVRPKSNFRSGARKTPAFINIDEDTLKMYIMQQM